jgi:uncharacterized protein YlxW (UPF0749 family)
VSDQERGRADAARARLAQLKDKVERATRLIAELRETNHALTGEIASLERKIASHEVHGRADRADWESGEGPDAPREETRNAPPVEPGVHEELQMLRDERKIIRAKVQNLLERIENLDL